MTANDGFKHTHRGMCKSGVQGHELSVTLHGTAESTSRDSEHAFVQMFISKKKYVNCAFENVLFSFHLFYSVIAILQIYTFKTS